MFIVEIVKHFDKKDKMFYFLFRQILVYYKTVSQQYFARHQSVLQFWLWTTWRIFFDCFFIKTSFLKLFYKGLKCLSDPIIQGKTTNNMFVYKLNNILRRKANWIGHILRRNCLLHVIEGHGHLIEAIQLKYARIF